MNKVDCYYYDEESDCCGALSDYSKMPCGLVPCTDDKCGMKEPRQSFKCTAKNCPLEFGNGIGRCTATICEYRTKPTNFDKITSSIDALVEYVIKNFHNYPEAIPCLKDGCDSQMKTDCIECFKKWLEQEA